MASEPTVFKIEDNVIIGEEDPIDDKCINIGELILNAFKSKPDFIGQVDATGEENTFQQMRERSVKCALWLKKFGVRKNDIVTVCTSNHLDTYIPFLATLYIGAILSVWNETRPINYRYYLQSNPISKVIFTDVDKATIILNMIKKINISTKIIVFKNKSEVEEEFESIKSILNNDFDETIIDEFACTKLESSKDTAVILFSSGTTDGVNRKHVAIPHAFFTAPSNQQIPIMLSNDVGIWTESLHWHIGLLLTVRAILSYVKVVKINRFSNPSFRKCLFDMVQKYKVTWIFLKISVGFNEFFAEMCDILENYDVSFLKEIILNCRITVDYTFNYFFSILPNVLITQVYSLPETGMIAHQKEIGHIVDFDSRPFIPPMPKSICYINKNVRLLFADFTTQLPLGAFKYGVVWCKSPSLTNGYFDMSGKLTAATDENGWFHTDEVGLYHPDGNIKIYNRGVHVIRYRDYCFSPLEIEQVLKCHPKVQTVAVIPKFNVSDGDHPLALIELKEFEGSKVTEKELIQYVAKYVDDCKQLRGGVMFVNDLPHCPNGQINRKKLYEWVKHDLRENKIK